MSAGEGLRVLSAEEERVLVALRELAERVRQCRGELAMEPFASALLQMGASRTWVCLKGGAMGFTMGGARFSLAQAATTPPAIELAFQQ